MFVLRLHGFAPRAGVRQGLSHEVPHGCLREPCPTALEPTAHLRDLSTLVLMSAETTPAWMGRDGGQVGRRRNE